MAMICISYQRLLVSGGASPFDSDDYGWPCRFMTIDCYDYARAPDGNYYSVAIRRQIDEFDSRCAAINFAVWSLLSFALWQRLNQTGRTVSLATLFRWIGSLAISICLCRYIGTVRLWGPFSNLIYWTKSTFAPTGTLEAQWGGWANFPWESVTWEPILYASLFVGIDYYTQLLLSVRQRLLRGRPESSSP
jgi:hypothetical protein